MACCFRLCWILSLLLCVSQAAVSEAVFRYDNASNRSVAAPKVAQSKLRRVSLKHKEAKLFLDAISSQQIASLCHLSDDAFLLLCTLTKSQYQELWRLIAWLDKPVNQFEIEVDVYELAYQESRKKDLGLSQLADGLSYKLESLQDTFKNKGGVLAFLDDLGEAKLLASPRLSVKEGEKASISVGDRIPFLKERIAYKERIAFVDFINTGVSLSVSPKDVGKQAVHIQIEADVSSVKRWQVLDSGTYPVLSRRHAKTQVYIPYNQQLILAGLIDSQQKKTVQKIPLLGDLPFIGSMFQKIQKESVHSDVIFLIRPKPLIWALKKKNGIEKSSKKAI